VPGLTDANSKIDLLDGAPAIKKKIKTAFCMEGNTENNPILAFIKSVLFPVSAARVRLLVEDGKFKPWVEDGAPAGTVFSVPRRDQETRHYTAFEDMQADFAHKEIHPGDLKAAVTAAITGLVAPILEAYQASEDWKDVESKAYPVPVNVVKQKKVRWDMFVYCSSLWTECEKCCAQDKGKDKSKGKPPAAAEDGDARTSSS
jgi:tyrosyl-tRNA synthetase